MSTLNDWLKEKKEKGINFNFFSYAGSAPTIDQFFLSHSVPKSFNHINYLKLHPEVQNFYQPFCSKNNISDRERLFFHKTFYSAENNIDLPILKYKTNSNGLKKFSNKNNSFLISYCLSVYNRLDFIKKTLPYNLSRKKNDEQIVIVDYNSSDGFYNWVKKNFNKYLLSNDLKYLFIHDQTSYNCSIAKNISHYYSDGKYVVNLDCDNYITGFRNQINRHLKKCSEKFILHLAALDKSESNHSHKEMEKHKGSYGRICLLKSDFISLGGYNESFLPIGYQDTDLINRGIKFGLKYFYRPIKEKPTLSHSKYFLFQTLDGENFYSYQDCLDYNRTVSENNINNQNYIAPNIKKNFKCELNFTSCFRINYSNCLMQQNPSNTFKQLNLDFKSIDLHSSFVNHKFDNYDDLIQFYIKYIFEDLLFQKPELIKSIQNKLMESIFDYSVSYCPFYKELLEGDPSFNAYSEHSFSRDSFSLDLSNRTSTYLDESRLVHQKTSGSTTGKSFEFLNDSKYFSLVQDLSEFKIIRKEFVLPEDNLNILVLLNWPGVAPQFDDFYFKVKNHNQHNPFCSFGAYSTVSTFVNFSKFLSNTNDWHDNLFSLLENSFFDVVLSNGGIINTLVKQIKDRNFKHKFGHLISQTTEYVKSSDLEFLVSNGNFNYYCNHMRGWDGGLTFFTCEHGTLHLNEGASLVYSDDSKKLVSTCFFNTATPFIRYKNGDIGNIEKEFSLCKCGRYYRPFSMDKSRPFSWKGVSDMKKLQEEILGLPFANLISQIKFAEGCFYVFLKKDLSASEKQLFKDSVGPFIDDTEIIFN